MSIFLHSFLIGALVALPTGSVGFLCVRRAFVHHGRDVFLSVLGSILGDMVFASIVICSITSALVFFTEYSHMIRVLGSIVLIGLGIKTFFTLHKDSTQDTSLIHRSAYFFSAFILTITNPVQLFTLPLIFVSVGTGITAGSGWGSSIIFILGFFLGAVVLWSMFVGIIFSFRKRLKVMHFNSINKVTGALIFGSGIFLLVGLFFKFY